jgi:hypothetical protein
VIFFLTLLRIGYRFLIVYIYFFINGHQICVSKFYSESEVTLTHFPTQFPSSKQRADHTLNPGFLQINTPHYLAIAVFIHEIDPSDRPILVTSNLATALRYSARYLFRLTMPYSASHTAPPSPKKTRSSLTPPKSGLRLAAGDTSEEPEIYRHFQVFNAPNFKFLRAQCISCSKELRCSLPLLRQHLEGCGKPEATRTLKKISSRAEAKEVLEQFEIFEDPAFKKPQARCLSCSKVQSYDSCTLLRKHLDKEHPETLAKRQPLSQHFVFFWDERFNEPRARCLYCSQVLSHRLPQIQGHLPRCQQLPIEVVRPSTRVRRCLKCWRNIRHERYAAHGKRCTKKLKCHLCQVWFEEAAIQKHRDECRQRFRECGRCKKARIPAGEWEANLSTCQSKRCHTCCKSVRGVDYDDHLKTCAFRYCWKCRKARIPMGEWEAHLSTCQFKRCHACEKRIRVVDFDDHLKACRYHRCGRCRQSRLQCKMWRLISPLVRTSSVAGLATS